MQTRISMESYPGFTQQVELNRVTRIAKELIDILRRDGNLFRKISPRTLRWIKKQDRLDRERKDAQDEVLRLAKRRRIALAKLSKKEQQLLGLLNSDYEE
jgi:hypothetical protein